MDNILSGGARILAFKGKVNVAQITEGLRCLERMGTLLGRDNILYCSAITGINEKMNTEIEKAFSDDYLFECFLAEALIQSLISGKYIDLTDVKNGFRDEHYRDIVLSYCGRYGVK